MQAQVMIVSLNLDDVVVREVVGDAEQLAAGVRVGERAYAEAVGGVELALEVLAAHLLHLLQLQQTGGGQEGLHVVLLDHQAARVAEVDERVERRRVHLVDVDLGCKHTHTEFRSTLTVHTFKETDPASTRACR